MGRGTGAPVETEQVKESRIMTHFFVQISGFSYRGDLGGKPNCGWGSYFIVVQKSGMCPQRIFPPSLLSMTTRGLEDFTDPFLVVQTLGFVWDFIA